MKLRIVKATVFGRSTAFHLLESPIEGGETGKTGLQGNFRDRDTGFHQQRFGRFDSFVAKIIIKIVTGTLLEYSGKVKFGKAGHIGDFFQCQILAKMLIQVVEDGIKLLHKVFLPGF